MVLGGFNLRLYLRKHREKKQGECCFWHPSCSGPLGELSIAHTEQSPRKHDGTDEEWKIRRKNNVSVLVLNHTTLVVNSLRSLLNHPQKIHPHIPCTFNPQHTSRRTHSYPMSLALRMVVWTQTSVVTPVKTRFRTPLVRSTFPKRGVFDGHMVGCFHEEQYRTKAKLEEVKSSSYSNLCRKRGWNTGARGATRSWKFFRNCVSPYQGPCQQTSLFRACRLLPHPPREPAPG